MISHSNNVDQNILPHLLQRLIDMELPRLLQQFKEQEQVYKQAKDKLSAIKRQQQQNNSNNNNNRNNNIPMVRLTAIEQSYLLYHKIITPNNNKILNSGGAMENANRIELITLLYPFVWNWDKLIETWLYEVNPTSILSKDLKVFSLYIISYHDRFASFTIDSK